MARRSRRRRKRLARRVARRVSSAARGARGVVRLLSAVVNIVLAFRRYDVCTCTWCLDTDAVLDLMGVGTPEETECVISALEGLEGTLCVTPVTAYELERSGHEPPVAVCRPSLAGVLAASIEAAVYVLRHGVSSPNTARDVLLLALAKRVAHGLVTGDERQCRRAPKFGLQCVRYKGKGICP